jgi:hypothetical protein
VRVQGHGLYRRQVCGLSEGWIVICVRRYLCRDCGHTMSCLPDWLHPWRWYAATAIIEALFRHLILKEAAQAISFRFGRSSGGWRSLRRWRAELLSSPTLWGWLGSRLGITAPAEDREEGRRHLNRLLAEMQVAYESTAKVLGGLRAAVRRSLSGLVHNRRHAWPILQFRPENDSMTDSGRKTRAIPTEEDPVRGPPGSSC